MKDKCRKKNMFKNNQNYYEESKLFLFSSIITLIFICSPLLFRIDFVKHGVSFFVKTLKTENYKSSYVETLGALLGTYWAITGALWTQRKEDRRKEKQSIMEFATVVYYDFKFAYRDIFEFIKLYEKVKIEKIDSLKHTMDSQENTVILESKMREYESKLNEIENNKKLLAPYYYVDMHIDNNWINNVAKLHTVLTASELKKIYEMYGNLEICKTYFKDDLKMIHKQGFSEFYNFLIDDMCARNFIGNKVNVTYKLADEKIMCKLDKLMNGICRDIE